MAKFKDLPLEIRDAIWGFCLSDWTEVEPPGIYFFDPSDFPLADNPTGSAMACNYERRVITALPKIMHVCRESRGFAKKHLSFQREQISADKWLELPYRRYRPEDDIFFVLNSRLKQFDLALRMTDFMATTPTGEDGERHFYQEITHLVYETAGFVYTSDAFYAFVCGMSDLRQLSIVRWPYLKNAHNEPNPQHSHAKLDEEKIDPMKQFGLETYFDIGNIDDVDDRSTGSYEILKSLDIGLERSRGGRDDGPYDEETGEELFGITVEELVRRPCII